MSDKEKKRHLMSILKTSNSPMKQKLNDTKIVKFKIPDAREIRQILKKFVLNENVKQYQDLVCSIRDCDIDDNDLILLLSATKECISLLNEDMRHFVEAIFKLHWAHRSKVAIQEYQSFLLDLLSAHNYHTKYAVDQLIQSFIPEDGELEWENGIPTQEEYQIFSNIHNLINILIKIIPMSCEILIKSITSNYPYFKKSTHQHEVYITNLLWILDYRPDFRLKIFSLIFIKLLELDVSAPRIDIEDSEDEIYSEDNIFKLNMDTDIDLENKMKHPIAHTLDVCLDKMLNYIYTQCHDCKTGQLCRDTANTLYNVMIKVFENSILKTPGACHVQFSIFYLCSFKLAFTEDFLNFLWNKVVNPSISQVYRIFSVSYISSFLARANYIPMSLLKNSLEQLVQWIHSYISNQDGLESIQFDVRIHTVFYSICQALFYVITFRHRDFIGTKKNLLFLQNLNLSRIVTSRLNPLKICLPAIVQNFAAVTRKYQLVYCYAVIENNSRSDMPIIFKDKNGSISTFISLDTYFPFDPYLLKRSSKYILNLYLEYNSSSSNDTTQQINTLVNEMDEENDDFLCDGSVKMKYSMCNKHMSFTYSSSPGYKTSH